MTIFKGFHYHSLTEAEYQNLPDSSVSNQISSGKEAHELNNDDIMMTERVEELPSCNFKVKEKNAFIENESSADEIECKDLIRICIFIWLPPH